MATRAVIVPVKATGQAKSRLVIAGRPAGEAASIRAHLARAMATDTIAVACATVGVHDVLVVTADPAVVAIARRAGARPVADAGSLNASLTAAATLLAGPLVVLPMDLVGVDSADLGACLSLVDRLLVDGPGDWFVPDATGTGTTLVGREAGSGRAFAYGPRSAARHAAAGFRRVLLPPALHRVHCDVDDVVGLWAAGPARTGPCVGAVLAQYDLVPAAHGVRAGTRQW